jgi:hypothetical protein
VEIRKSKTNKFLDKKKDLFSKRWNPRGSGTLIECIYNDVSRPSPWESENLFETVRHGPIARRMDTTVVCRIKASEYVATMIGLSGKLDEERGQ